MPKSITEHLREWRFKLPSKTANTELCFCPQRSLSSHMPSANWIYSPNFSLCKSSHLLAYKKKANMDSKSEILSPSFFYYNFVPSYVQRHQFHKRIQFYSAHLQTTCPPVPNSTLTYCWNFSYNVFNLRWRINNWRRRKRSMAVENNSK